VTEDEKIAEVWADAMAQLQAEIDAGRIVNIAWLADRGVSGDGNSKYRFGHKGYSDSRLVLTDALIAMRDGQTTSARTN